MSARARSGFARCVLGVIAGTMLLLPGVASACAVCMSGTQQDTRLAFILMTAFMTLTPLIVLFFAVRWFLRLAREHDREQELARDAASAHTSHLRATPARQ